MHKYIANMAALTALSAALLAVGCGGGGGGTPAAGAPDVIAPGPVAQRSVTGVASKGTIKKARVQVFALDAQGNKGTNPIASAITGEDGSYTLKIPTTVLSFVVEVDAEPAL